MIHRMQPGSEAVDRIRICGLVVLALLSLQGAAMGQSFQAARPVWPTGRSTEKNVQVGFRAVFDAESPKEVILRLTASTVYRATVNGEHVGYGPARGPHGHYRIDEWSITPRLKARANVVAVEVAGYNLNSYYLLDQPSFLQAEIVADGKPLASTGGTGFTALIPGERAQKVQRYSFQRPFSEVWRIRPDHGRWLADAAATIEPVACDSPASVSNGRRLRYLPRRAPYPEFKVRRDVSRIGAGTVVPIPSVTNLWKDRSLVAIGEKLKGYPEGELEIIPSIEMQKLASRPALAADASSAAPKKLVEGEPLAIGAGEYRILDFGLNNTGFIGVTVTCKEPSKLVLAFDEVLREGDVDFKRLGCVNLIWYEIPAGTFTLESFEPYTLRYLKAIVLAGRCELKDAWLREYSCPGVDRGTFRSSDPRLDRLFAAGRETFRQNTIDTFMDCPSRERAGWLCDSFFTSRVAPDLRGDTSVEATLMENFLLPEKFEFIPEGMLPMCYPADHNDGVFIPNWAMWLVVEIEEYLARSGDRETCDRLKGRVLRLIDYLRQFRNSDGLLEKLPSWVFVEWSDANSYVQDVNYPSNMLWAGTLSAASRLYGMKDLADEAERVRETVRKQSFDGTFFVDNAVRKADGKLPGGKLEATRNRTEVCQYFAFFFDVATPKTHGKLWTTLRDRFGPDRAKSNPFPDVGLANSFIGNILRMELLSRQGRSQQILDESVGYLLYMADRTGTLWENAGDYASCNHGFASHIVHTFFRDVLGAREVDRVAKKLRIRFAPLSLEWCEGTIPTPQGPIELSWRKKGDVLEYTCRTPAGYSVEVENASGMRLETR